MFLDKQKGGSRRGGCASYAVFALSIFVLAAFVFVSVVFDLSFCIFTSFFVFVPVLVTKRKISGKEVAEVVTKVVLVVTRHLDKEVIRL